MLYTSVGSLIPFLVLCLIFGMILADGANDKHATDSTKYGLRKILD